MTNQSTATKQKLEVIMGRTIIHKEGNNTDSNLNNIPNKLSLSCTITITITKEENGKQLLSLQHQTLQKKAQLIFKIRGNFLEEIAPYLSKIS